MEQIREEVRVGHHEPKKGVLEFQVSAEIFERLKASENISVTCEVREMVFKKEEALNPPKKLETKAEEKLSKVENEANAKVIELVEQAEGRPLTLGEVLGLVEAIMYKDLATQEENLRHNDLIQNIKNAIKSTIINLKEKVVEPGEVKLDFNIIDSNLVELNNYLDKLEVKITVFSNSPTPDNASSMVGWASIIWGTYMAGCAMQPPLYNAKIAIPDKLKAMFLKAQESFKLKSSSLSSGKMADSELKMMALNEEIKMFPPKWILSNSFTLKDLSP